MNYKIVSDSASNLISMKDFPYDSEEGTLKPVNKARGDKKAMQKLVSYMKSLGYNGGKIVISHSDNMSACEELKRLIQEAFGKFNGFIHENTALCGYYAELHSVLIGFEV